MRLFCVDLNEISQNGCDGFDNLILSKCAIPIFMNEYEFGCKRNFNSQEAWSSVNYVLKRKLGASSKDDQHAELPSTKLHESK